MSKADIHNRFSHEFVMKVVSTTSNMGTVGDRHGAGDATDIVEYREVSV